MNTVFWLNFVKLIDQFNASEIKNIDSVKKALNRLKERYFNARYIKPRDPWKGKAPFKNGEAFKQKLFTKFSKYN